MEITKTSDVYIPGSPEYLILAGERGVVNFTVSPPKIVAYLVPAIIVQKDNPLNITAIEKMYILLPPLPDFFPSGTMMKPLAFEITLDKEESL